MQNSILDDLIDLQSENFKMGKEYNEIIDEISTKEKDLKKYFTSEAQNTYDDITWLYNNLEGCACKIFFKQGFKTALQIIAECFFNNNEKQ